LEWITQSPPPTTNFEETPVVTWEAYEYSDMDELEMTEAEDEMAEEAEATLGIENKFKKENKK